MYKINKLYFGILFLIILLFSINSSIYAVDEEITLSEAFEIAKSKNIEISEARKNYEISKNEIKKLDENLDWKLSFSNNFGYNKNDIYEGFKDDVNISLNRKYYSGLQLSSTVGIIEKEPFDFNNIEDKFSYNLNISLPLYPKIPTENEKILVELEDNFEIMKLRLNNLIKEKEINWLEYYLSILRLKENIILINEKEKLLLDNLNKTKEEYEIGEIGKYDLLNAEILLKELRINLKSLENQLEQQKNYFYNTLGIKNKYKIKFSEEDVLVKKIKEKTKRAILKDNLNNIYSKGKENNPELKSLKKELKRKSDDYEVIEKKSGIEIKTNTAYQNSSLSQNENLEISVGISWDIFDKNLENIESDDLKKEINHIKNKISYIENDTILEIDSLIDENEVFNLEKENISIKLDSHKLEMENAQIKYKEDLISRTEFLETKFKYRERLNEKYEIEDKLLINKLEILNLIEAY